MADIEQRLRTAMHTAVDGAETEPDALIHQVMRRHRRRSLRSVMIAILTALAVAAPVATALEGGFAAAEHGTKLPSQLPRRMTGQRVPVGTNFEFIVTTPHGAGWYSTATRKIEPISGLAPVPGGYSFGWTDGGWILEPTQSTATCPYNKCVGRPSTFYFVANEGHAAIRIGKAWAVAAANQPGAVWVVTYPHATSGYNAPSVQLTSLSGTALSPRYHMPADQFLDSAVGNYLLIGDSPWVHFELWDPRSGHVIQRFTNVLATGPEQVAWAPSCSGAHCPVLVTNVSTAKTITVPFAQSTSPSAIFSEDGQLLAVQRTGSRLMVVDTVTGKITRIPGSVLATTANAAVGPPGPVWENFNWQDDGHRLVIDAGPLATPGPDQIAYWQPGDTHLYVTTITNAAELPEIQTGVPG